MELWVLDDTFEVVKIIDSFKSLIWVIRYDAFGDFELVMPAKTELLAIFKEDYYIWLRQNDNYMFIEDVQTLDDLEEGNRLLITGRSLESILFRRIVWSTTIVKGNFQDGIERLLNENAIAPTDPLRKIENFIFKKSTNPTITELEINSQYFGEDLYTILEEQCKLNEIGFRVTLNDNNIFEFELYKGEDRSYAQEANDYVIFSPAFENLANVSYLKSKKDYKTTTLVIGEGEEDLREHVIVDRDPQRTGLKRREIFTDASGVSYLDDEGWTISTAEYLELLNEEGAKVLKNKDIIKVFEGEVDFTKNFTYGVDFFMGDIVQLVNQYTVEEEAVISELIFSQDDTGVEIYPTFRIDKGEVI